jgi:kinesin family protein 15
MLGDIDNLDKMPSENRGMIPRVFEYLFARIRKVSISKMKFLNPKLKLWVC